MRSTLSAILFFAALGGLTAYLFMNHMTGAAALTAFIMLVGAATLLAASETAGGRTEADMNRKNKEDLPFFYKDGGRK